MDVHRDRVGEHAHPLAPDGIVRQETGIAACLGEIFDGGERLREPLAIDVENGHEPLRIARQMLRRLVRLGEQIDRHRTIAFAEAVERDTHPIARRRTPVVVKDGLAHAFARSCRSAV
ncbi:hypothetical protein D9M70_436970 [compost metagenome]